MRVPTFSDFSKLPEDDRIDIIGKAVMSMGLTTAFVVDDDAKADRYMQKLKDRFPGIRELVRFKIPSKKVPKAHWPTAVKVSPPEDHPVGPDTAASSFAA